MHIREFFRFELREQLRSPLLWLIAGLFGLFAFALGSSDAVQLGGTVGNVHRNAPLVLIQFLGLASLMGLFVICIFIAAALLRDFEAGTADLLFSHPIRKRDFLIGRFGAGLAGSLMVYVLFGVGLFVAGFMPWIDPERLGPHSGWPYLWAFAVIVLPNLLLTGAMLALLAVTTRSLLAVYVGIIAFFVLYIMSGVLLRDLDNLWVAVLADPFGLRALSRATRYWSAEDRNTRLPELAGYIIANRALWIAVGLGLAAAAFRFFRTDRAGTGKAWWRRGASAPAAASAARTPAAAAAAAPLRRVAPATGLALAFAQYRRLLGFDLRAVFTSVPFLVMLLFGLTNFLGAASDMGAVYGTPSRPVTSQMLVMLEGAYGWLIYVIVMFYAGELVWRERQAKLADVVDAMPVRDALPILAKLTTLVAVVVVFLGAGVLAAMGLQLVKGEVALEPLLYLKGLGAMAVPALLVGGMALVLQVLANNKFIGYGLLIAGLVLMPLLAYFDFSDNLYTYAGGPGLPYSDLNGYGHFWIGWAWFRAYWGLFLAALLVLATAFWVRGTSTTRRERIALARQRLTGPLGVALAVFALAWAGVGGFLYWNTHVLNTYRSGDEAIALQVRYERDYARYADTPQPLVTAQSIEVDLDPDERRLEIRGEVAYTNPHAEPLAEIHVQLTPEAEHPVLDLGEATLAHDDAELGYRIYRLAEPMAPGATGTLRYTMRMHDRGFGNATGQTRVVGNGSFFNSFLMPSFGYSVQRTVQDRNERREQGLEPAPRMRDLDDPVGREHHYISDDGHWIDFEATFCTAPDQIGLAPGYLVREFERDGRRCFEYAMDRKILPFYAFLSARWEVTRGEYNGLPIEVYHHPAHHWNVERMIESVRDSLAYYEANFSPYQHRQVRIIEFPGYSDFAQAFPNTIPYSESIGFIADLRDPEDIDYVYYVTAHEIAHQWWAHQVISADVQGSTVMVESLAQYSALMVMEREYGRAHMRRFLRAELDRYLGDRGGESREELPLYRVENQPYIHYRKGSLVFYRLREEMGEEALNRALARYIADKAYQSPPFTTTRELLAYLRAEAGEAQQQVITDLFERITFYDNRVVEASARRGEGERHVVTATVHAAKFSADGVGRETAEPVDDWMDVVVYGRADDGGERELLRERRRIVLAPGGTLALELEVEGRPVAIGIDPDNVLIDRVPADNRRDVAVARD